MASSLRMGMKKNKNEGVGGIVFWNRTFQLWKVVEFNKEKQNFSRIFFYLDGLREAPLRSISFFVL
jgi:hypothetical protein